MTLAKLIDDLVAWFQDNVASVHQFKVPPPDDMPETDNYQYALAHPVVYPYLVPLIGEGLDQMTEEGTPLQIAPAIAVQTLDGNEESVSEGGSDGRVRVRVVFQLWNPGFHYIDVEGKRSFRRNGDGWRDLHTLFDTAHERIKAARILNGHLVIDGAISFSPLMEQGAVVDSYPFFHGEISFNVKFVKPFTFNNFK